MSVRQFTAGSNRQSCIRAHMGLPFAKGTALAHIDRALARTSEARNATAGRTLRPPAAQQRHPRLPRARAGAGPPSIHLCSSLGRAQRRTMRRLGGHGAAPAALLVEDGGSLLATGTGDAVSSSSGSPVAAASPAHSHKPPPQQGAADDPGYLRLWRTHDSVFAWVALFTNLPGRGVGRPWSTNGLALGPAVSCLRWLAVALAVIQLAWAAGQWPCTYNLRRRTAFMLLQRSLRLAVATSEAGLQAAALEALAARLQGVEPTAAALRLCFGAPLVRGCVRGCVLPWRLPAWACLRGGRRRSCHYCQQPALPPSSPGSDGAG